MMKSLPSFLFALCISCAAAAVAAAQDIPAEDAARVTRALGEQSSQKLRRRRPHPEALTEDEKRRLFLDIAFEPDQPAAQERKSVCSSIIAVDGWRKSPEDKGRSNTDTSTQRTNNTRRRRIQEDGDVVLQYEDEQTNHPDEDWIRIGAAEGLEDVMMALPMGLGDDQEYASFEEHDADSDIFIQYQDKEFVETDEEFVCELDDGSIVPIEGTGEQISELRALLNNGTLVSGLSSVITEHFGGGSFTGWDGVQDFVEDVTDGIQDFMGDVASVGKKFVEDVLATPVALPSGSIQLYDNKKNGDERRRKLANTNKFEGTKKVLLVRVTDGKGRSINGPAAELSDRFFGSYGDRVTVKSGFEACSFGKLTMSYDYGDQVDRRLLSAPGVVDVRINLRLDMTSQSSIITAARQAVQQKLGFTLPGPFDHVMFALEECYPVGDNKCNYAAFAFVNHWLSYFVGDNYKYPAVVMHELGHNLNLGHSGGLDGKVYTDHTCLMGDPLWEDNVGRMCFNPVKNFQIAKKGQSWFDSKHIVNFNSGTAGGTSWRGKLIGVAEYKNNPADLPFILKLETGNGSDYFFAFNRATGINADSAQARNQVTFYRVQSGDGLSYSQSTLKGKLWAGQSATIGNWRESGQNLRVKVHEINTNARPGYADIEILFGPQSTAASNTPRPTPRPTPKPTPRPTPKPSIKMESRQLTLNPSKKPTGNPCGNSICEIGETPNTCPSDCFMKSFWTRSFTNANAGGQMFTISAAWASIAITSFEIVAKREGESEILIFTRAGNYRGHETNGQAWQLIMNKSQYLRQSRPTSLGSFSEEVTIPAGSTQAFYIWSNNAMVYLKGNGAQGYSFGRDGPFQINEGIATKKVFDKVIGSAQYSGGVRWYEYDE